MGNCYHQQFQFSVENIDNFNDFDETIDISNDFEETIENFNGFEETIENFQWFWRTPSPLNVFWYADHWQRWFFNGFGVVQPLVSMVFDGQGPLVKRWNGFNGSNRSNPNDCINLSFLKNQDGHEDDDCVRDILSYTIKLDHVFEIDNPLSIILSPKSQYHSWP